MEWAEIIHSESYLLPVDTIEIVFYVSYLLMFESKYGPHPTVYYTC